MNPNVRRRLIIALCLLVLCLLALGLYAQLKELLYHDLTPVPQVFQAGGRGALPAHPSFERSRLYEKISK